MSEDTVGALIAHLYQFQLEFSHCIFIHSDKIITVYEGNAIAGLRKGRLWDSCRKYEHYKALGQTLIFFLSEKEASLANRGNLK